MIIKQQDAIKSSNLHQTNKQTNKQHQQTRPKTTKSKKKHRKTTNNNKRQQQQAKTATTTWTQPKQTSINHSHKQNPTATPQNTPKQHDLPELQKKTALLPLYRSSKESFASPVFTLRVGAWHRDSYPTLVAVHQLKRSIYQKLTPFQGFYWWVHLQPSSIWKKSSWARKYHFFFRRGGACS